MTPEVLALAIRTAHRSYCRFRVSAIAFDKHGKIISTAANQPRFDKKHGGIHAEMIALRKGGSRVTSMVVCRVGHSGILRPIHVCPNCQKILDKNRVKVFTVKALASGIKMQS